MTNRNIINIIKTIKLRGQEAKTVHTASNFSSQGHSSRSNLTKISSNHFQGYHNIYSYQATSISDQQLFSKYADRQIVMHIHRQTQVRAAKNNRLLLQHSWHVW